MRRQWLTTWDVTRPCCQVVYEVIGSTHGYPFVFKTDHSSRKVRMPEGGKIVSYCIHQSVQSVDSQHSYLGEAWDNIRTDKNGLQVYAECGQCWWMKWSCQTSRISEGQKHFRWSYFNTRILIKAIFGIYVYMRDNIWANVFMSCTCTVLWTSFYSLSTGQRKG
jgi:hypothetical protein